MHISLLSKAILSQKQYSLETLEKEEVQMLNVLTDEHNKEEY